MTMIIMRALYSFKTSVKALSEFYGKLLKEMGYTSCVADPDVWIKPAVNDKGFTYWSYMLVYVDDCFAVHHDPAPIMEDLKSRYNLKNDVYGEPAQYLGTNVGTYQLD